MNLLFHIIIQHCCIETWALGNAHLPHEYTRTQNSVKFADFQAYYDILIDDPELMNGKQVIKILNQHGWQELRV